MAAVQRIWMGFATVITHGATTLVCALIMVFTSVWEIGQTLVGDILTLSFKTGHGVLLFGTIQAIRSAQELLKSK